MSKLAVWRGIGVVLLATSLEASLGTAKIHIRLVDLAGLPGKVTVQAETAVAGIFRTAGVDLDFQPPPGDMDHCLQILPQRPKNLHADTTGYAVLPRSARPGDSYAVVSYPAVESVADELGVSPASVLAAAMAHEIGHLLLHSSVHSKDGVMSPRLDHCQIRLLERGELRFTDGQAARLRER